MKDDDLLKKARSLKAVAEEVQIMATPIDFDQLIKDGLIKKIGKSYYADNIHALPNNVAKKIKSLSETKKGLKLTFHKETKKNINRAEAIKHLID